MHRLNWTSGEQGKGIVNHDGSVHTWNTDEYPYHYSYLEAHPHVESKGYFYITPEGAIDVTYPNKRYDPPEECADALSKILDADPRHHENPTGDWYL